MPRTMVTETQVYKYEELDDEAKEKAYDKWRDVECQDWHWDYVYEDAERVATILGITFDTRQVKLMNGSTRPEVCIWFSGFWSQGDGACFEGTYRYAKGSAKEIRKYAPQDKDLHSIADRLQAVQKKFLYRLRAHVTHRGHYYHAYSTDISVYDSENEYRDIGDAEDEVKGCLRDFMDWIYKQLKAEYEYQVSEEAFESAVECNDWEFDEDGNII